MKNRNRLRARSQKYGNLNVEQKVYRYEDIEEISKYLLNNTKHRPTIGIICGSGLGGLADHVTDADIIPYENIPNFPISTVSGHSGCLVFGTMSGVSVVCMKGRFHPYEGYPVSKCSMPVRVIKLMGIKKLIVTNAAGGLNADYKIGDIMIIKDHINFLGFSGDSPLKGKNDERFGPRFPAMSNAYDRDLIEIARSSAKQLDLMKYLREGVYVLTGGPAYETIAEIRFLRNCGGDAVGMSTVHEVIVAHHCDIKVIGFSLITNKCIADYDSNLLTNHQEVLDTAQMRAKDFERLIAKIVESLDN